VLQGALAPFAASAALFAGYLVVKFFPNLNLQAFLNAYFWLIGSIAIFGALQSPLRQSVSPIRLAISFGCGSCLYTTSAFCSKSLTIDHTFKPHTCSCSCQSELLNHNSIVLNAVTLLSTMEELPKASQTTSHCTQAQMLKCSQGSCQRSFLMCRQVH